MKVRPDGMNAIQSDRENREASCELLAWFGVLRPLRAHAHCGECECSAVGVGVVLAGRGVCLRGERGGIGDERVALGWECCWSCARGQNAGGRDRRAETEVCRRGGGSRRVVEGVWRRRRNVDDSRGTRPAWVTRVGDGMGVTGLQVVLLRSVLRALCTVGWRESQVRPATTLRPAFLLPCVHLWTLHF